MPVLIPVLILLRPLLNCLAFDGSGTCSTAGSKCASGFDGSWCCAATLRLLRIGVVCFLVAFVVNLAMN